MKKIILSIIAVLAFGFTNAQETKFGVKAGVDLVTTKVDLGPFGTASASETGIFAGGFVTIGLSEKFAFQPEVLFIAVTDYNMVNVPLLGRYSFTNKIHAVAGPSLVYALDATEDEFKLNVDLGGSYDITDHIEGNIKYSYGFGDVSVSGLFIGVGYKF